MEGNTHLLQVIREMHSQIDKLERENRALKEELRACGLSASVGGGSGEMGSLPCPAEGPDALPTAPMDQADTTMTVRRYSTAASAPSRPHRASKQPQSSGQLEERGRAEPHACPTAAQRFSDVGRGLGKSPADCFSSSSSSKLRLFQEHVRRCRGKVKAVSFLLPMDVSYAENQGSFKSPQNQDTKQLSTITEKDM
ncbi:putative coiled-coil domain-containing protein 195 [Phasianus colchicus]|uniref:putative coiled-coil domain-containing protein 195 n=1 Tax=Phasianus colchicus TaxID=9054 RepID=UPI00129DDFD5|nr:putative coiled-coil domain-containing protein 195 [Phasianus colchicus]